MKNNKWKCIKETTEKSFDFMNKSELQGRFVDVLNEAIDQWKKNDAMDMVEEADTWIDDYINDPEWGLVASTMRDMEKYVHRDDTSLFGNFADIRLDWEREHDDVSLDEVVEMIDNGEVNDITNEFRSWSIDWYFRAFGTYNLKYNWGEFIENEVAERDYEGERDLIANESRKTKLDPYFSDNFDLTELSENELYDLYEMIDSELESAKDEMRDSLGKKDAKKYKDCRMKMDILKTNMDRVSDGIEYYVGNRGEGFQFESSEDDVQMTSIKLNPNDYKWICKALDSTPDEMDVPQEEAIWKVTGKFDDGTECDIILQSSQDDFWIDGVLYDEDGSQLCMTEPCYDILDDWEFEYDGTKYICTVKI